MGSLAGLMSLLSPVALPHRPASTSSTPIHPPNYRSTSDGAVLQALAKRVTPVRRRVLAPMTLANERLPEDNGIRYRRARTREHAEKMKRKASGDGSEEGTVEGSVVSCFPFHDWPVLTTDTISCPSTTSASSHCSPPVSPRMAIPSPLSPRHLPVT